MNKNQVAKRTKRNLRSKQKRKERNIKTQKKKEVASLKNKEFRKFFQNFHKTQQIKNSKDAEEGQEPQFESS